jgi:S1-C subfamily serine protease
MSPEKSRAVFFMVFVAALTCGGCDSRPPREAARLEDVALAQAADPIPAPPPVLPPADKRDLELSPEEESNVRVYAQTNKSVVNIVTRAAQVDDVFFSVTPRQGSGSGSILDKAGHIVTNNHVIEDAQAIVVTLFDGSAHPAKLVGADPSNDLAVIKIDVPQDKLMPLPWGDSEKLAVGMRVYAIGNPFGLERTLTLGIVSSLGRMLRTDNNRTIRGIIQTDAAINPGNSGGPLLNRRGELIGINTAIVSRAGQSSGVGLAIPANTARRVVDELVRFGRVIRPDLGIVGVYATNDGLLIARLTPNGPAQKAGLKGPEERVVQRGGFLYRTLDRSRADAIVGIGGKRVRTLDELLTEVEKHRPGQEVTVQVRRDGRLIDVPLTLEVTPAQ